MAFIVYLWTLSRGAYPGESALLIAHHSGVDPFASVHPPVWGILARGIAFFPLGGLAFRLNVLGALCGASTLGLLFMVVSGIPHNKTREEREVRFPTLQAGLISGLVATLFLAFSVPYWTLSIQAHYYSFHLLLLLIAVRLLKRFEARAADANIVPFAALYGLGMIESPLFLLAAPGFAASLVMILWRKNMLQDRTLLIRVLVALFAGALVAMLPTSLMYRFSNAYHWRETSGYASVLWLIISDVLRSTVETLRQPGWLLLLLVSVVPWLVVVVATKNPDDHWTDRAGSWLLHFAVSLLGGAMWFNLPPAPYAITPRALAAAPWYLLSSIWIGYVAGYWFVRLSARPNRVAGVRVLVVVLGVTLWFAAVRNGPWADGRAARPVNVLARAMVEALDDRPWLVVNDWMDPHLRIAAADRRQTMTLVNLAHSHLPPYRRYVAAQFDAPRLRALAPLGVAVLFNGWMTTEPRINEILAVSSLPEWWEETGFYPLPDRGLFIGIGKTERPPDVDDYSRQQRAFWASLQRDLDRPSAHSLPHHRWIRQHVGRQANNSGVYMEERGASGWAWEAYGIARAFDPENVSALLNATRLATTEAYPEQQELHDALALIIAQHQGRFNHRLLAARYGVVRDPQMHVQKGLAWAASGHAQAARSEIERAGEMAGSAPLLRYELAAFYMRDGDWQESEDLLLQLQAEYPERIHLALQLVRLAVLQGDAEKARARLDALPASVTHTPAWVIEAALVDAAEGHIERGMERLWNHTTAHPDHQMVWNALLALALDARDRVWLTSIVESMEALSLEDAKTHMSLVRAYMQLERAESAREVLERMRVQNPRDIRPLEQLLRLDIAAREKEQARTHVAQLLERDTGHSWGRYVQGRLQMEVRDYTAAEQSMRYSLLRDESPLALSDLAWLLQRRGAWQEAEVLARRALDLEPDLPSGLYTLTEILLQREQWQEAEQFIHIALEQLPDHPGNRLNQSEWLLRTGHTQEGTALLEALLQNKADLPEKLKERAERLRLNLDK